MRRTILRLFILKLASLCLVGTCYAQNKIVTFAQAIARAEGFGARGALPTRYHNPGDLKARPGEQYPGQLRIGKGGHVIFKNDTAGWNALYHQINKALSGESRWYRQDMTLREVAKRYAANSARWAQNVARELQVTPDTTLEAYFFGEKHETILRSRTPSDTGERLYLYQPDGEENPDGLFTLYSESQVNGFCSEMVCELVTPEMVWPEHRGKGKTF